MITLYIYGFSCPEILVLRVLTVCFNWNYIFTRLNYFFIENVVAFALIITLLRSKFAPLTLTSIAWAKYILPEIKRVINCISFMTQCCSHYKQRKQIMIKLLHINTMLLLHNKVFTQTITLFSEFISLKWTTNNLSIEGFLVQEEATFVFKQTVNIDI